MLTYCAVKGVELLIGEFESYGPTDGFMGVTIALLFFFTVYVLETVGRGIWFRPVVRNLLGDYAYPVRQVNQGKKRTLLKHDRLLQYSGPDLPIFRAS